MTNGLNPESQPVLESLKFEDVLDYWQNLVSELHGKLAVAEARVKHRDRVIADLQSRTNQDIPTPSTLPSSLRIPD